MAARPRPGRLLPGRVRRERRAASPREVAGFARHQDRSSSRPTRATSRAFGLQVSDVRRDYVRTHGSHARRRSTRPRPRKPGSRSRRRPTSTSPAEGIEAARVIALALGRRALRRRGERGHRACPDGTARGRGPRPRVGGIPRRARSHLRVRLPRPAGRRAGQPPAAGRRRGLSPACAGDRATKRAIGR